jgi:hypothetical protein
MLVRTRELHRHLIGKSDKRRRTMDNNYVGTGTPTPSRRSSRHQADNEGKSEEMVYVADIINRTGDRTAQECFWDFGRWSDLWKMWRPVPDGAGFEQCLGGGADNQEVRGSMGCRSMCQRLYSAEKAAILLFQDGVRWARVLCELMKEVWHQCGEAASMVYGEVAAKLQALLSMDSNGRQILPHDSKSVLARSYCLLLAPLVDAGQHGDNKRLTSREFVRMLVFSARTGIEALQQIAVLALGNINPACQALVAQEAAIMSEDFLDRPGRVSLLTQFVL